MILDHTLLQWKTLWQQRNDVVHNNETNARVSEKKLRVQAELTHIYKQREEYLSKDKDILFDTLEEHQALPLSTIQNWLLLYKNHLRNSAATAKKLSLKHVRSIKEYFTI